MEGTARTPSLGFSPEECASCNGQGIGADQQPCTAKRACLGAVHAVPLVLWPPGSQQAAVSGMYIIVCSA
jgi:hypothetical protein